MSRSIGDHRRTSRLFLLLRMGGDHYALDACEMVEVLPLLHLKRIPETPEWVTGVFSHRGVPVLVLDLCTMAFGRAALARTSTCIVLIEHRARQEQESVWFGLVFEQVTDTPRREPSVFRDYGLDNDRAHHLGLVYEGPWRLMQWVWAEVLLLDEVCVLSFPPECGEGAA